MHYLGSDVVTYNTTYPPTTYLLSRASYIHLDSENLARMAAPFPSPEIQAKVASEGESLFIFIFQNYESA